MLIKHDIISRFNINVDAGHDINSSQLDVFCRQLDVIESALLKSNIINIFKSVPITIYPADKFGARYRLNFGIEVGMLDIPFDRPVILHEMMHAFHFERLPDGFANKTLLKFYEIALRSRMYPEKSYVLSSVQEFFAITATVIACGEIKRPPFTRNNLKIKQPIYYQWLANVLQDTIIKIESERM